MDNPCSDSYPNETIEAWQKSECYACNTYSEGVKEGRRQVIEEMRSQCREHEHKEGYYIPRMYCDKCMEKFIFELKGEL